METDRFEIKTSMFDFMKITIKPARKYVRICVIDRYTYSSPTYDEHTFDIENEADAQRTIKEFIVNKENSPELVFEVGFCENPRCVKLLEAENCCKHRIDSFNYDTDYTYITGYSDITYKIQIVL